jgi:nucleotide-binding universal stress UspA family protein
LSFAHAARGNFMNKRMRILIAYDGSVCADNAIEDLLHAGLPGEAEALVMSVEEEWMPSPLMSSYDLVSTMVPIQTNLAIKAVPELRPQVSEALELALRAKERVQELFPDWEVMEFSCIGSPATEILNEAEEWGADLIVVGAHGHTALGKFFFGSVSHKIVMESHCTVRVSRRSTENACQEEKILVGVDNSRGAKAALRAIAGRKWHVDTAVKLIIVIDPLKPSGTENFLAELDDIYQEEREWAQDIVEQQADDLQRRGLNVSFAVQAGDPKRILIHESQEWQATTIFVGATGLTGVDPFLPGSISAAVATRAQCSVEVARQTKLRAI